MDEVASTQHFPRGGRPEPVLITEAEESREDQHARRKRRYAITMGIRAVSLVLAVSLLHVIPLWLDLTLAALGTLLPGFAVVMANDRPPKKRVKVSHYDARPDHQLPRSTSSGRVIDA